MIFDTKGNLLKFEKNDLLKISEAVFQIDEVTAEKLNSALNILIKDRIPKSRETVKVFRLENGTGELMVAELILSHFVKK